MERCLVFRFFRRDLKSAMVAGLAALLIGCGGSETYRVSGVVTCDGEPLADGHIAFLPDGAGAGQGSTITNGQYQVSIPPGRARVQITASKRFPLPAGKVDMYGNREEVRQFLPAKYNTKSTLTADIHGPTDLDFALHTK